MCDAIAGVVIDEVRADFAFADSDEKALGNLRVALTRLQTLSTRCSAPAVSDVPKLLDALEWLLRASAGAAAPASADVVDLTAASVELQTSLLLWQAGAALAAGASVKEGDDERRAAAHEQLLGVRARRDAALNAFAALLQSETAGIRQRVMPSLLLVAGALLASRGVRNPLKCELPAALVDALDAELAAVMALGADASADADADADDDDAGALAADADTQRRVLQETTLSGYAVLINLGVLPLEKTINVYSKLVSVGAPVATVTYLSLCGCNL
jgi:hypothetical protein